MPAAADQSMFRVGLICSNTLPEVIVVEASGPGLIMLRIEDAFAACVSEMKESKRWQGKT
jgi:hypothetical protein